jgi:hypothetical protein
LDACRYFGFESNPAWRRPPADPVLETPTWLQMTEADLVILDSDPDYRFLELELWTEHGKPGSVVVVHDAGNGHSPVTLHAQIGLACTETGMPGMALKNPRGGWLGVHR